MRIRFGSNSWSILIGMKKEDQVELLWNTFDFYANNIKTLEGEYEFLCGRTQQYFIQPVIDSFILMQKDPEFSKSLPLEQIKEIESLLGEYDEGNTPVNKEELISSINKISDNLLEFYKKHINVIGEILDFYSENPYSIPKNRRIKRKPLHSLKKSILKLLHKHKHNKEKMILSIGEYLDNE